MQVGTLLSVQDEQSLLNWDVLRVSYYREKQWGWEGGEGGGGWGAGGSGGSVGGGGGGSLL